MTALGRIDWAEMALLDRPESALYKPPPTLDAQVAQLVEHATENRSVGGSIPPLGTIISMTYATRSRKLDTFRDELDTYVLFLLPSGSNFFIITCSRTEVSADAV